MLHSKKFWIVAMSLVCALSLVGAAACTDGGTTETKTYTVTYAAGAADATGTAPAAEKYAEGATVTLKGADVFAREGYTFEAWGFESKTYQAGAAYTMPAKDVTFTAQWKQDEVEPLPDGTEKVTEVPTGALETKNGAATVDWLASYAEDGVKVIAWVQDEKLFTDSTIYKNDSVQVILAAAGRVMSYTDKTISVLVDATGAVEVKNCGTGDKLEDSGVTTECKLFTLDEKTLAGYRVTVTIPYALAGVDKTAADAVLALGVTNASNAANGITVFDGTYDTDEGHVYTYAHLKADDTFERNAFFTLGETWGDGGAMKMSPVWNLEHDDGTADAFIEMETADPATDNNIYMKDTGSKTNYYAEVKLSLEEVCKTADGSFDGWPKFGLTIFSADGSRGIFLYVDAVDAVTVDKQTEVDGVINADSTALGYNFREGGAWKGDWANIGSVGATSDAYQNGNFVTLGIYRQGAYFRLVFNGEAVGAPITTAGIGEKEQAYIGIASFKLRLKAKDYKIDETPETLAKYNIAREEVEIPEPTKTIDGDLADWTEADKANPVTIPASEGRKVTVYAAKDEKGVYIMYDVLHKSYIDKADAPWHETTNAEFGLADMGGTYHVAANGQNDIGKGTAFMKHIAPTEDGGLHHTTVEVFLPWVSVPGCDASSEVVPAGFCWKTIGEDGFVWDWEQKDDKGNDVRDHAYWLVPEADARMHNSFITDHGFLKGSEKTIDGNDADWADYEEVTLGHSNSTTAATAKVTLDTDGLYVFVKVVGANIDVNTDEGGVGNWYKNTNLEFFNANQIFATNVSSSRVMIVRGEIYHTGYITEAAYHFEKGADGADDTLTFEVFVSYRHLNKSITDASRTISIRFGGQIYHTVAVEETYNDFVSDSNLLPVYNENYTPTAPTVSVEKGDENAAGDDIAVTPVWDVKKGVYTIELPDCTFTFEGHTFHNWSVKIGDGTATSHQHGETIEVPEGATVTVTAVWTDNAAQNVTVTFELGYEGDDAPAELLAEKDGYAAAEDIPVIGRGGYAFEGWFIVNEGTMTEEKFDENYQITKDITVRAKWTDVIDGDLSNWTEKQKAHFIELTGDNGRYVRMYVTMDDYGVNVFYDVKHNMLLTGYSDWWKNTNVEFFFGETSGKQFYVAAAAEGQAQQHQNIDHFIFTNTQEDGGLYHSVFEAFVPYSDIDGFTKDNQFMNGFFAWKTDDLAGKFENGFTQLLGDPGVYVCDSSSENAHWRRSTVFTRDGILGAQKATVKTIDGNLDDWQDDDFTASEADKLAKNVTARWAAKRESDGIYIALEIKAPTIDMRGSNKGGAWWQNTNFELWGGEEAAHYSARIMWNEQQETVFTSGIDDAKMVYTSNADGDDVLILEVFVSNYRSRATATRIDIGGQLWGDDRDGNTGDNRAFQDYARYIAMKQA